MTLLLVLVFSLISVYERDYPIPTLICSVCVFLGVNRYTMADLASLCAVREEMCSGAWGAHVLAPAPLVPWMGVLSQPRPVHSYFSMRYYKAFGFTAPLKTSTSILFFSEAAK